MVVYKITNKLNGKIYIGQTIMSLEKRWHYHILSANKHYAKSEFYADIRTLGIDNFTVEVLDTAETQADLNYLEAYYIVGYDSVRRGYNKAYGSLGGQNSMFDANIKLKHDEVCRSVDNRLKISESMKKYRKEHPFTKDHKEKLSAKAVGNTNGKGNSSHSVSCYCIDDGVRRDFVNYKEAGLWWYHTYHPFGDKYSQATYQRKIIDCIEQ